MKISAIDIRKHTFEKIFRGYDPEAVDAFLNSLSQEWERYTSENNQLRSQLEYTEKELAKLKDIESSLFRTLKTAEITGQQIEKEAIETAAQTIADSLKQSEEMLAEAESRTGKVIEDTEMRLAGLKEAFALEIKNQERDFRAIENFRDNLIVQLSSLANSTIDTVERFEQKYDKESVLNKMDEIKSHVAEIVIPKKAENKEIEVTILEIDDSVVDEFTLDASDEDFTDILELEPTTIIQSQIIQEEEEDNIIATPQEKETELVEEKLSAVEEAHEALRAMHNTAEQARENTQSPNKSAKSQESISSKETGGGSFFDQI
tara:strand:- start:356 stop:1312 length:957 start_codon:yes stop_codon:yes gene_type:complete